MLYQRDGKRKFDSNDQPILKYLIIHHSAGNEFINATQMIIQDAFSAAGYQRGYERYGYNEYGFSPKYGQCYHKHPSRDTISFAMAEYALHQNNDSKLGWELVPLIEMPLENVAGATFEATINEIAISIEICGDYTNKLIDPNALVCIAQEFQGLGLEVKGHKDFDVTGCPGRIYEQLDILRKLMEA